MARCVFRVVDGGAELVALCRDVLLRRLHLHHHKQSGIRVEKNSPTGLFIHFCHIGSKEMKKSTRTKTS